jgi:deoxyribose-phosphate aldolase
MAALVDHSLLRPDATAADIGRLCREAVEFEFCTVCVNPQYVDYAVSALKGSSVRACTVIGFPLGATLTDVKAFEAREAANLGADELDIVMNIGAAKAGDWDTVENDISSIVTATVGLVHKVIIEACYLNDGQKAAAALTALRAGAAFVKTSTGFGPGGATAHDVRLIRKAVGPEAGIKAAGGIKTLANAMEMLGAGATRIGTSSGPSIIRELERE